MSVHAPRDTISKFCQAAGAAGVSYIQPTWYGIDPSHEELCKDTLHTAKRDGLIEEIKRLGVTKYLFLASGFWYGFSLGGGPNRYGFDFTKNELVIFDKGNVKMNTTTWAQTGRAMASLFSLQELPNDENDKSVTLAQFADSTVYVSSFLVSQKDMFESVKRVTGTSEAEWKITYESSEDRYKEAMAGIKEDNFNTYTKMLYSRTWFPNGGADYETAHGTANAALGLPEEDLDEATKEAIRMGLGGEVPFGN